MSAIITLTTDFGLGDGYVAAMKGVMLGIDPTLQLVDLSHEIGAQDVQEAAFVLANTAFWFPQSTVHLVVVDPGVGTARRAIAVRTRRHTFVAPDNGVLSWALEREAAVESVSLTNSDYWHRTETSSTFHGRDIFAPAAAHLATGVPIQALGEPISDLIRLPKPSMSDNRDRTLEGEIIHVDRFGNLISNIPGQRLPKEATVVIDDRNVGTIRRTYADVTIGDLLALVGSHGFVEVAVRQGSAADTLEINRGAPIKVLIG